MIELQIDSIRVSLRHYQRVVVLKEDNSQRFLPIWIGADVAEAIVLSLQDIDLPRPLTHDLMNDLIDQLGGTVDSVIVNNLENDTYFACIRVKCKDQLIEIDARPSDAIALSVRTKSPIFVDSDVFERACINIDKEDNVIVDNKLAQNKDNQISDEELQKLSAFQDFVSELDLDLSQQDEDLNQKDSN
tara:strand:- start:48 stop:611 length:564 start_codon:yes stop_codon:yes gene_type:complete